METLKIVLTGGPCGGKTTSIQAIEQEFEEKGYHVIVVPEAATILINSGIRPFGKNALTQKEFQRHVMALQFFLEERASEAAKKIDAPTIIVCDRGLLDDKAYVTEEEYKELLKEFNTTQFEIQNRYDLVIHLKTAADGKEEYYTLANNGARTETPEEAREKDRRTLEAWLGHDNLKIMGNEVRRRVDAEINDIKETLKPENTPENMKRLSELEKSRDKRLAKARDAEFETLSQDVRNRYNDIRTALKNEIKDMARMQVEHILDLYRRGKNTNKEEIYQALNELLTKKLDNEELDDIIFNTVMPLVKKHSELFNIWNSYNELNQEKNEEPTTVEIPPEPHGTQKPVDELTEGKEEDKDKETGDEPKEVQPNVNAKWRTIASIAVGIGLGAGVWFAFGAAGVAALTIGGGIAKRLLAKKQAKLEMLREQGELKVHRAEDFPPTLKGQLQRFRSYINGPEGLDAIQKVLTASIITGVGFNILGPILGLEGGQVITALKGMGSTGTGSTSAGTGTVTNTVNNTNQTTTGLKAGDLRVGDSAGNLTTGYTDSYKALSGTDGVGLNQTFINNESSQIGSFLVRKGTESFTVTDSSLTVSEIATKFGVAETDIVANVVQNGTNIPQSWNSLSEIVNAKNIVNAIGEGGKAI